MTKKIFTVIGALLLLFTGSMQAQDDYNPTLPGEPQTPQPPVVKYALTVTCQPTAAGKAAGSGSYTAGTRVTVSTSANAEYTFSHWELNGTRYEAAKATSFSYTTIAEEMKFVAVYDYTPTPFEPSNPAEPFAKVKSRLYLESNPAGICTFNRTSGQAWDVETYVSVNVTNINQQYEFKGWYLNEVLLTTEKSFNYQIDYHDATLVAYFDRLPDPEPEPEVPFEPNLPGEPNQDDNKYTEDDVVQTHAKGDANKDGVINVADAVAVINIYLGYEAEGISRGLADANADGTINVADVVYIINHYLFNAE